MPSFKVGNWFAVPALNVLERGGRSIGIEPRAMDVLAYLAAHPGEVVSINELIEFVWKNNVTDGSVYRVINQLRHIFEDKNGEPRYIQTVPKRGYRLVAEVRIQSEQFGPRDKTERAGWRKTPWFQKPMSYGVPAMFVLVIVGALVYRASEQEKIAEPVTASESANALYLRAINLLRYPSPQASPDRFAQAHGYLDEAIALDPELAHAHAYKAIMYASKLGAVTRISDELTLSDLEALARNHAQTALRLNPNLGLAYSALGRLHESFWREVEARQAYEQAYRLNPDEPYILHDYRLFSLNSDRYDDAIKLAHEMSEEDLGFKIYSLSHTLFWSGDYEGAANAIAQVLDMHPPIADAHWGLSEIELVRGNHAKALEEIRLAERLIGDESFQAPGFLAELAYTYGLAGSHEDAVRVFNRIETMADEYSVGMATWAMAYLAIGDQESALEWITRAADTKMPDEGFWVGWMLRRNVLSDPILEQPEFVKVRGRLGFD